LSGTNSGGTTTGAIDTTGATRLVISVCSHLGTAAPTVFDSKSNTLVPRTVQNGAAERIQLFDCFNPTVGSGHTFSATGTNTFASVGVQAFAGGGAFSVENGNVGNGVSMFAGSVVVPTAGLAVTAIGADLADTYAVGSNFVISDQLPFSSSNYFGQAMAYLLSSTAQTVNPPWTGGPADSTPAVIAAYA
jgi:hypothetical protein